MEEFTKDELHGIQACLLLVKSLIQIQEGFPKDEINKTRQMLIRATNDIENLDKEAPFDKLLDKVQMLKDNT